MQDQTAEDTAALRIDELNQAFAHCFVLVGERLVVVRSCSSGAVKVSSMRQRRRIECALLLLLLGVVAAVGHLAVRVLVRVHVRVRVVGMRCMVRVRCVHLLQQRCAIC